MEMVFGINTNDSLLGVVSYELGVMSCELGVMSWEFK